MDRIANIVEASAKRLRAIYKSEAPSTRKSTRFLELPLEVRYLVYEQLLADGPVAVRSCDELATTKIHAAWGLALTSKQIHSEMTHIIIQKGLFRFVIPYGLFQVADRETGKFDFIAAFLLHASWDDQYSVLQDLKIRVGYRLLRDPDNAVRIPSDITSDLAFRFNVITDVQIELPALPLLCPTNAMVLNNVNIQNIVNPPHGIPQWSTDGSDIHWPVDGVPGLDLSYPWFVNTYHSDDEFILTARNCRNELDFYKHQALQALAYDKYILCVKIPVRHRSEDWLRVTSLELGYVKTGFGSISWVAKVAFQLKIDRSGSAAPLRQAVSASQCGHTVSQPSEDTCTQETYHEMERLPDVQIRYMKRLNDDTINPLELYHPRRRHLREGHYPNAIEKDGIIVVSKLNADGEFIDP